MHVSVARFQHDLTAIAKFPHEWAISNNADVARSGPFKIFKFDSNECQKNGTKIQIKLYAVELLSCLIFNCLRSLNVSKAIDRFSSSFMTARYE